MTTPDAVDATNRDREVAGTMAAAAVAWLSALEPDQRAAAHWAPRRG